MTQDTPETTSPKSDWNKPFPGRGRPHLLLLLGGSKVEQGSKEAEVTGKQ